MTRAKKRRNVYSKGEINRLIDGLVHPLIDLDSAHRNFAGEKIVEGLFNPSVGQTV